MGKYGGLHPNDDAGHAIYEEQHRGHPDPNPYIECAGQCGESYAFKDYWQPRYVKPDDANFTHDDSEPVPRPREHRDRYRRTSTNASGRTVVMEARDAWLASDVTVAIER